MTTAIKDMTLEQVATEIKEIRPILSKAFTEGGSTLDMSKVTAFGDGLDEHGKSERLASMNIRLNELAERKQALEAAEQAQKQLGSLGEWLDTPAGDAPPMGDGAKRYTPLAKAAAPFLETLKKGSKRAEFTAEVDGKEFVDHELKTVVSTGAGFAPQSIRTGVVTPFPVQQPMMLDLIPTYRTDQAAYVFMRQTTRTNAAAEVAESVQGDLKSLAESAFVWTQESEPVQRIGHWVPVTDQQLKYIDGMQDLLNNDMRDGVRERLSSQLLNGNGSAPNISGFLDAGRTDVNDVNTTGKFIADAVDMLLEEVAATGFAEADAVVVNTRDWHGYRRATTQDGIYINGHPSEVGPRTMWGLPVVATTEIAAGSALAGAFRRYSRLVLGSGIELAISSEHASFFIQGTNAIKAEVYATLAVHREAAFAKTDDIAV